MRVKLYKLYSTRLYMHLAPFAKKLSLTKDTTFRTPLTPKFNNQKSLQNENPSNRPVDSGHSE